MLYIFSVDFLLQNYWKACKEFLHVRLIGNKVRVRNIGTSCTSVMELVIKDEPFACFRLKFWVGFFRLSSIRFRRAPYYVTTFLSSVVWLPEALEDGRVPYSVWIFLDCDVFIK